MPTVQTTAGSYTYSGTVC